MKGRSDIKITGPRTALAALFTVNAINRPTPMTNGSVSNVNISVKRSAFQKSICRMSLTLPEATASQTLSICSTFR